MTTSISLCYKRDYLVKHNFVLSHLEHLSPKNTNKKILLIKNVVFFSVNFKIDGKLGILSRFQFIKNQQNCSIV